MASELPLLKISSNLEISQSNRKNLPTENEFSLTSQKIDGQQLDVPSEKNADTETTKNDTLADTQEQDEECLKAEKLLKSLLLIDIAEKHERDLSSEVDAGSVQADEVLESNVPPKTSEEHSESNSNDSTDHPTNSETKTPKRRRRRRTRKRKVIQAEDIEEQSTTDPEVKSTTSVSKSSSSTTCSSGVECAQVEQSTGEQLSIELVGGSDSAISQDERYQDLITEEYVMDFEQRIIKENLFIEHERLAKEVAAFELELNSQLEKSEAMEQSLKQLKTENNLLKREKTGLLQEITTKEKEIAAFKEQASSLKATCKAISQTEEKEAKTSYIELDNLKSQLLTKEDELELAKRKHENEYKQLAKNHGMFLADVLNEAQEINNILYTPLRSNLTKPKPEARKTNNVLLLLKQLKQDILTLTEKSNVLEVTVKELRDEVETQAKALTKVTNEKRVLKEQVAETEKQNKALVKEKAKLEREKETLKAEATRAKNMSQNCKARLEEFKANARSAKREKEIVQREKQDIETMLKNHGVDYKALLLNIGKSDKDLETLKDLKRPEATNESEIQNSTSDKTNEQSYKLNEIITRITKDGICLKRVVELISKGYLNVEELVETLYCKCGCYESEAAQREFLENIPLLAQCVAALVNSKMSMEMAEDFVAKLEQFQSENNLLKSERSKYEKSLENYKELVRGYSHIVHELEERVVGVREMKCINRELEKYSVLLEQQKDGMGIQFVGIHEGLNLIHAMFQRLKRFAGNFVNTDLSTTSGERSEHITLKSLEQANKFLKEKLAYSEYNLGLLKATLGRKRTEATEVQTQIHEALFGSKQCPAVESPEQKTTKKAKGNGLLGLKKAKSPPKVETKSPPLCEKQLAVVIDLVQCKEQLVIGIQESVDLEQRLERLGKASRECMDTLLTKNSHFVANKMANTSVANLELFNCLKEKQRIENEFSFKEAHTRLLEKQIALLKSERKACLKAVRRYEELMKGVARNSMVSTLARLLSSSAASDEKKSSKNGAAKDGTCRGKGGMLSHGNKGVVSGSNV